MSKVRWAVHHNTGGSSFWFALRLCAYDVLIYPQALLLEYQCWRLDNLGVYVKLPHTFTCTTPNFLGTFSLLQWCERPWNFIHRDRRWLMYSPSVLGIYLPAWSPRSLRARAIVWAHERHWNDVFAVKDILRLSRNDTHIKIFEKIFLSLFLRGFLTG